ncbi:MULTISPECIES: ATP-binding protein [Pseudomonas]|uniref:histidine kinase n=1 Tax=Pseudomonas quercus TaxID=2722792 RepID=A0ABX0YEZ5_9PSED|nr:MULTISPECIES: ATP-binding protein [Pseudomonas]MBF7143046.1 GAF domain-containing protein [Pseudomonas sp. LY10J]NJP01925.1 GAF domain-containing protein [Pseudomonas quercus]
MDNCAREPIRIPGSIQPQGFMLVIEEPGMVIRQFSENLMAWLGVDADQLLGARFPDVIRDGHELVEQLGELEEDESHPYHVADVEFLIGKAGPVALPMMLHRYDQVLVVEFERPTSETVTHNRLYPIVRSFISSAPEIETVQGLCERAVRVVKRLTGFGRVKTYKFDEQGNGLVNAELLDDGYQSYLGLCFPASDIPAQARALYCSNRIRVIEDANYTPSRLIPANNPLTGQPLDMSYATLRSVSPIHLQYMRNMQTLSSMSISIVVEGKLWGLVSCHHSDPHTVSFQTRTACELLGRVLSLQIESRESRLNAARMLDIRQRMVQLLSAIADHDSVLLGLRAETDTFLGFVGAEGAAVVSTTGCDLYGDTPAKTDVQLLAEWLFKRPANDFFETDNASQSIPELPAIGEATSGVMAVAISELHPHYLIWFKPEQAHVVHWAGKPDKILGDTGSLNPRQSFEQWRQVVHGFSTPWLASEAEGVQELRQAVLGIVLRKAEELAQMSEELDRSNKELEAFSYSVSHDLRAPLRHIAGFTDLLTDMESDNLSERGQRFVTTIADSARFAGTLVDNLLSFSQMGRNAIHLAPIDLRKLVDTIRVELQPDYEGREVQWHYTDLPELVADPAFIHLAMRNLISNALKYSRTQPVTIIDVTAAKRDHDTVVCVQDNGVGFDMQYVDKLFGVFQRLHRMEEYEGTGIGLANVRRIVERHGGQVWAKAAPNKGAAFSFTLPHATVPPLPDEADGPS